jgi:molybdate transport system substrate-binding protein
MRVGSKGFAGCSKWLTGGLACGLMCTAVRAGAEEVQVAVASNFAGPMKALATAFAKESGHRALIIAGATGKLYAQIKNDAPFEVLLAADEPTPAKLEQEGLAVPGSSFTYAVGKLALYSARGGYVDNDGAVLKSGAFRHLALANPKLAPYGAAAIEVLSRLGLLESLQPKFVTGENIAQAFEFVATGNAELGFVAWSQVIALDEARKGSYWLVPAALYAPIRQGAVLLRKGAGRQAPLALFAYLQSQTARKIIESHGYGLAVTTATSSAAAASANP